MSRSDNFNRGGGAYLSASPTPSDGGSNWVVDNTASAGFYFVTSLYLEYYGAGQSSQAVLDCGATDHEASITVIAPGASGTLWSLVIAYQDSSNYLAAEFEVATNLCRIKSVIAGVETTLTSFGVTLAANDIPAFGRVGTTLTVKKNGTAAGSTTSSALAAATKAGLRGISNSSGGAPRWDSFAITASAGSAATTYTLSASPTSITAGSSTTVTVTPNGTFTGTITVTPSGSASTGLSAQTLTWSGTSSAQTVTFTPTVAGTLTLTGTNGGSLTNPSAASVTVAAASFTAGTPAGVCSPSGVALYLDGTNGSTAPTGTAPFAYQWHRSSTPNFTPGSGTAISGATTQNYTDTSGTEGVNYWYACAVSDSAAGSGTASYVEGMKLKAALKVGFVGDSLYYNTPTGGNPPPTNFATLLPYRSGHAYSVATVNGGAPGSATADWLSTASAWPGPPSTSSQNLLAWAKSQFAAAGVTYVFLRLGANDGLHGVTAATYGSNLSAIVSNLTAAGYTVILNYPTYGRDGGSYGGSINALYQQYQAQVDALVNGSTVRAGDKRLFDYSAAFGTSFRIDDIHPNASGSMLMAQQDVDTLLGIVSPAAGSGGVRRLNFGGGF